MLERVCSPLPNMNEVCRLTGSNAKSKAVAEGVLVTASLKEKFG